MRQCTQVVVGKTSMVNLSTSFVPTRMWDKEDAGARTASNDTPRIEGANQPGVGGDADADADADDDDDADADDDADDADADADVPVTPILEGTLTSDIDTSTRK